MKKVLILISTLILSLCASEMLAQRVVKGEKITLECVDCEQIKNKDCDVCKSRSEKRIFDGLIVRIGNVPILIDAPYSIVTKGNTLYLEDWQRDKVTIPLKQVSYFLADGTKQYPKKMKDLLELVKACSCESLKIEDIPVSSCEDVTDCLDGLFGFSTDTVTVDNVTTVTNCMTFNGTDFCDSWSYENCDVIGVSIDTNWVDRVMTIETCTETSCDEFCEEISFEIPCEQIWLEQTFAVAADGENSFVVAQGQLPDNPAKITIERNGKDYDLTTGYTYDPASGAVQFAVPNTLIGDCVKIRHCVCAP